jgi:hypothetical protein
MEELASIPDAKDVNAAKRQLAAFSNRQLAVVTPAAGVPLDRYFGSLPQCKYLI